MVVARACCFDPSTLTVSRAEVSGTGITVKTSEKSPRGRSMRVSQRVTVCAAVTAMVLAGMSQTGVAGAAIPKSGSNHHAVPSSTPEWLASAKHLGGVSTAAAVNFRVYLAPRGGVDTVKAAVAAASTPG